MLYETLWTFEFWRLRRVGTAVWHGYICIMKSHSSCVHVFGKGIQIPLDLGSYVSCKKQKGMLWLNI